MDLLYVKCAGLDVHPRSVSACARRIVEGRATHEVRTFGTSTRELTTMAEWLASVGCAHVAMESTGVYWKPVWHVLEGRFELVLANAMYIRISRSDGGPLVRLGHASALVLDGDHPRPTRRRGVTPEMVARIGVPVLLSGVAL